MKNQLALLLAAAGALCASNAGAAGQSEEEAATSKWMVEQERTWAQQECGQKSILKELLADDFYGTSPKANRYTKAEAVAQAASGKPRGTDCRLLQADVHFFGPVTAIIYGSETAVETKEDGKPDRYCLIWTDTWLKRDGKWHIAAAQDARFACPTM